ncbi:MAG TPA: hypothetical protein VGL02_30135 [Streptomyces sp.]
MSARDEAIKASAAIVDRILNEPGLTDAQRIALSRDALKASAAVRAATEAEAQDGAQ